MCLNCLIRKLFYLFIYLFVGAIKQASMPSYCSTYCSCLLTRAYLVDASSLYRRYYVLQQTALLAEKCGTKVHPASCPKCPNKKKTSLPQHKLVLLVDEYDKTINQSFDNLRKRQSDLHDAIGIYYC